MLPPVPENFRDPRASVPVVVPRSKKSADESLQRAVAVMAIFLSGGAHAAAYILVALLTTAAGPSGSPDEGDGSVLDIAMVGGGTEPLAEAGEEEETPPPSPPPQEAAPAAPEIAPPRPRRERPPEPEPEPVAEPEPVEEPAEPEAAEATSPEDGTGLDPESVAREAFIESLMEQHRGAGGAAGSGASEDQEGGGGSGLGCSDPFSGTWQARRYRGSQDHWVVFTARLSGSGSSLSGTLTYRSWNGGPSQRRPPPCGPGVFDDTVFMRARGSIHGNQARIDAVSYSRTSHCMDFGFGYNLDHFTGTVEGDRFNAVNNDGGMDIDEPYVFRRISCE
jgi:outer membrane biosynthesis protein TonB